MSGRPMISEPLASILRSGRSDFNSRFAEARRRFPGLSSEVFSASLTEMVDPAVKAVASLRPDCIAETVSVAFDVALELAGQNLTGLAARSSAITEGWRKLLPAAASHLAESPRNVLPAVSNALHHLAITPGANPACWISDMSRLAGDCRDVDIFLKLGQAAAWRCGLAHYRSSALALLDLLPERLSLALLETPSSLSWPDVSARLKRDPWYNPASQPEKQNAGGALRPVSRVGTFRGFGGLFIEPPQVAVNDKSILVRSGEESWLLTADCFGATFHCCDLSLFKSSATGSVLPSGVVVAGTTIRRNGFSLNMAQYGSISSTAATPDTLAITSTLTHAVMLVALT